MAIPAHTDLQGAMHIAEQIRINIEQMAIPHSASLPYNIVTISLGVATSARSTEISHEDLIRYADEALYRAKHFGRNRVQYYQGQ